MISLLKRHTFRIVIGLLLTLGFYMDATQPPQQRFVNRLEDSLYDYRLNLALKKDAFDSIVILDIDEKSLAKEGQWPWSRNKLALLLDQLFDRYKVAVVGFDAVFPEPDRSSGLDVLRGLSEKELRAVPEFRSALEQVSPRLDYNRMFAEKLKGRPVVMGYTFLPELAKGQILDAWLIPPPLFKDEFLQRNAFPHAYQSYVSNLAALQANAASGGFFNTTPDADGVIRRTPVLAEYQGQFYEPLWLAMFRVALDNPAITPKYSDFSLRGKANKNLEFLEIEGGTKIPVDDRIAALIPYRGLEGSFPYYSIVDVLNGKLPLENLKGKTVLIGTRVEGLKDLRSTPVGPTYPGVEIHANMIAGLMTGSIWQSSDQQRATERIMIIIIGLSLAFLLPVLSPLRASLMALAALAVTIGINFYAWKYEYSVIPLAALLLLVVTLFVFNMSYGFFVETRRTRRITEAFGQYVAPERVQELSDNPDKASMEGESREMTVLFSDVRGFTRLSEGMDPKALTSLMNAYLTPMTQIVQKHRGTIDKYIGDALMSFWGAPLPDAKHAENAVRAALDMQTQMVKLNQEFRTRGWPEIEIGIGINTGIMSVGDMGSEFRRAYTVMGDSVNLASRLESLTKEYGVPIIVGDETRRAMPDMLFLELDLVRVKGKQEPVTIYQPLGSTQEVGEKAVEETGSFHDALAAYRARRWDDAEALLRDLLQTSPGALLYKMYLARISTFRHAPPAEGWDFIFTHEVK